MRNQQNKTKKKKKEDPTHIWSCEFLISPQTAKDCGNMVELSYKFLTSCNNGYVKMFDIVDGKLQLVRT
jgi:hypothetical protein